MTTCNTFKVDLVGHTKYIFKKKQTIVLCLYRKKNPNMSVTVKFYLVLNNL